VKAMREILFRGKRKDNGEWVEYCMCLEHNNNVLEHNFENQYRNCMKLLDDMKLINDTYKNRRKEGAE
jgi:uncharacterized protein YdeI (YjbR/CyaY-like superfamily)